MSDTFLDRDPIGATSGILAVLVALSRSSSSSGGIVTTNMMPTVVSERTREIGPAQSLGARCPEDHGADAERESFCCRCSGAFIGTLLGALIAIGISRLTPVPAAVQLWSVALGIGDHGRRRSVLRLVPGDSGRRAWIRLRR